jgi:hypothetical protein
LHARADALDFCLNRQILEFTGTPEKRRLKRRSEKQLVTLR